MSMSTKDLLLVELVKTPGRYRSGDELAQLLGLSRESIWKAIQGLKKSGHQIASQKKRGYAYLQSDHVNQVALKQALLQAGFAPDAFASIHIFDDVGSTQALAKEALAHQAVQRPAVYVARGQSAGYGRQCRSFYSPKDRGLYVSLALPVTPGVDLAPSLLTTSAAVALVQGLQDCFSDLDLSLKWVNDLILAGRKVGGVLTEGVFDFERQQYSAVVLGFAINVLPGTVPADLQEKIGFLLPAAEKVDLNVLLACLLARLWQMAQSYRSGAYLPQYRALSFLIGRRVTVRVDGADRTGRVLDISDQGGLVFLVDGEQGPQTLYAGEVRKVALFDQLNL
ncbi:biotin--[acetyl-CoA-carboxylase] ligase [Leuconostocaceae bacterium ESL0958]|nr:biotin--[acetyl-CoA-carboxylase] ligase [Leuconostocaceae bacterium ESL0958]